MVISTRAGQFSAVLRGKIRRQHTHGFHFVRIHIRCEGGRAVLRQRLAVDDKLHIVLRAARMKDTVGFKEPARLRRRQVQKVASGLRAEGFLDGLASDGKQRARCGWVHQCLFIIHLDFGGDRGNAKQDIHFDRHDGVNFNDIAPGGEALCLNGQPITPKGRSCSR